MKVYLAGPIFQCNDRECVAWRQEAKAKLKGFDVIDPMETTDFRGKTKAFFRELVESGKARIDSSDIILANITKPSIGTSMEILYGWERGKKVYVVEQQEHINPWLLYHAEHLFESLDEAISYLNERT